MELTLDDIRFDNHGTWIPQDGVKYYWYSIPQERLCVVSQISDYGRSLSIRTPELTTTVILPHRTWFRPLQTVEDAAVKYDEYALLDRAVRE